MESRVYSEETLRKSCQSFATVLGQRLNAAFNSSRLWKRLELLFLRENMRVRTADDDNRRFVEWQRSLSYKKEMDGIIELPDYISQTEDIQRLYNEIFPPALLQRAASDFETFRSSAILACHNASVNEVNAILLGQLPGSAREYASVNIVDTDGMDQMQIPADEVLQAVDLSSLPPGKLMLKVGAPVILIRNIAPDQGLCNGTRLAVTALRKYTIVGRILGGAFHGQERVIPRIKLHSNDEALGFRFSRTQIPVRLCFAMTINKAQGQSFEHVGLDLRTSVFSHGQFYVAVSRVTDVHNLLVLYRPESGGKVQNIVYPEVLLTLPE